MTSPAAVISFVSIKFSGSLIVKQKDFQPIYQGQNLGASHKAFGTHSANLHSQLSPKKQTRCSHPFKKPDASTPLKKIILVQKLDHMSLISSKRFSIPSKTTAGPYATASATCPVPP